MSTDNVAIAALDLRASNPGLRETPVRAFSLETVMSRPPSHWLPRRHTRQRLASPALLTTVATVALLCVTAALPARTSTAHTALPATAALAHTVAFRTAVPVHPRAPITTSVTINGQGTGQVFGGVGAISGGGGNTRLLIDYPEPYRSQILDYLFKPGYGAALQILKVEVGGDADSTDGSESSIEHTRGSVDCNSGYEWWLMEQAKARNPDIKLYGLAWGAPGWIGNGNFWSTDMTNYLLAWLNCAKSHGLTVNYLGGWNENGWVGSWFVKLRKALDAAGYPQVQLVAADNAGWAVAKSLASNAAFDKATAIIGSHYPCGGDGSPAYKCTTTSTARGLGKPLWASENGSQDFNSGAPAMIRAITRGYLDAKMTAYINWPVVAAIPANLPWETMGLLQANQPWSGNYTPGEQLWTAAQVTQFTQPGWSFIDGASGYLGGNRAHGSYVTLQSPGSTAYSMVAETTTATSPQTLDISVTGGLPTSTVHVWSTNLASANPSDYFAHAPDITPSSGHYSLTLKPGYIYTLSTTTGQAKGTATSPPPASFALPYTDDISHMSYPAASEPPYLADQDGAFEVQPCLGGRSGNCLQQMSPAVPIEWASHTGTPYTVIGDGSWANYTISADFLLHQPGSADLLGRFQGRDYYQIGHAAAYYLRIDDRGNWSILKNTTGGTVTTLDSGTVPALGLGTWHHFSLSCQGSTITAAVDGKTVGSASDSSYASGLAGLGVGVGDTSDSGWLTDQFDNLRITPIGATSAAAAAEELVNRASRQVMGVAGNSTVAGAPIETARYTAARGQQWTLTGDGNTPGRPELVNTGSEMALTTRGTSQAQLTQEPAQQASGQRWRFAPVPGSRFFTLLAANGMAVTAQRSSHARQTPVVLAPRRGSTNQQWQLLPAPAADLAATFDNTGITDDSDPNPTPGFIGFDGIATSYSAQGLATAGLTPGASVSTNGTTLTWPNVASAQPDNTMAMGQAIALHGSGSRLTFLLAANNAPMAGAGTVYYTDGTATPFMLAAGNFWFPAGQAGAMGNTQVAAVNYANYPAGSSGHTVYVFAQSVPLDPHKTVAEVVLPVLPGVTGNNAALHVFALGVS
ncbi:MAG TPA: RICIN domain-containing protein [Streptosporangiaceae bacterium]|nr:RICIN domain-containing protein [Streptosporangiaceae bacterium]